MTDKNTLTKIIRLLGLQATDLVVEIGPGQGALTRCLLASGATVLAVEKDTVLSAQLQSTLAQEKLPGFLGVIEADIMALSVSSLLDHLHGLVPGDRKGQHKVKVVANMPFNITTEVIRHLLPQGDFISQVNLLIEEGAAQRLVKARPGQDIYRSINCLVHYFATPHYHFRVPRTVFYPRPHVDAAMTTFALKPASDRLLDARLESGFVKFVEKAFLAKRKRLRNTLGPQYSSSQVEAALQAVGLKQDTRAVELSASSYALLYAELGSSLKH